MYKKRLLELRKTNVILPTPHSNQRLNAKCSHRSRDYFCRNICLIFFSKKTCLSGNLVEVSKRSKFFLEKC